MLYLAACPVVVLCHQCYNLANYNLQASFAKAAWPMVLSRCLSILLPSLCRHPSFLPSHYLSLSLSPSSLLTFLSRCSWRMNTRTPSQPSRGSGPLQHLCPLRALKQGVYILFLLFSFLVFSFLFSSLLFCSLLFPPLLFLISTLSIIT